MSKRYLFLLLRATLIPFFVRELIQRKRTTIILYHDIEPEIADMHFKILKSRYNIIALKDYVEARKNGNSSRLPPKSLIITLDDGHKNNYRLKPVLEKNDIPVTIFLCSGIADTKRHFWFSYGAGNILRQRLKKVDDNTRLDVLAMYGFAEEKEFSERQALSAGEIEEMKDLVDFQSHTRFHPVLPRCTEERAKSEVFCSKDELELLSGRKIYALSYPNGDYSQREIIMAKEAGYDCGISLDYGWNTQRSDLFRLKRICVPDDADINELLVRTSGVWDFLKNNLKGRVKAWRARQL